ncbi:phosphatase PAP2 family protein [Paludibacterium paludis]|uniref:Phosphatidic acid phosphatase type 2/haloperoxidase domain-containing protein n=1 Tax=Paludibacterium paludis TaxID=1225769 RepID=A0A918NXW6_9NEIS|nr:phosphatase PAP2 family protein [Paludibacterium paludis]GGY04967.1 hypothetical protein GCM10011289_04400 [Paludibacterium paludis]
MLSAEIWPWLSRLGDSSVMLRTGLVIALGLLARREWRWPLYLILAMSVTVVSKILYLGWGIGIDSLAFRGFSGHSQMAAAILPLLAAGLAPRGIRAQMFALGMALAFLVGISRLEVHAHTPSEVAGGLALGYAVSLAAARRALPAWTGLPVACRALAGLVTLWYFVHFVPAPTQGIIGRLSLELARVL